MEGGAATVQFREGSFRLYVPRTREWRGKVKVVNRRRRPSRLERRGQARGRVGGGRRIYGKGSARRVSRLVAPASSAFPVQSGSECEAKFSIETAGPLKGGVTRVID